MKSQVEDAIRERKYRKAMDTYRSELHALEERLLREMRDPANLVALGLPPAMPETSLRILAKTFKEFPHIVLDFPGELFFCAIHLFDDGVKFHVLLSQQLFRCAHARCKESLLLVQRP